MGDWDHISKAAGAALSGFIVCAIALLITLPLAIWKIIDIVIWLFGKAAP